MTVQAHRQAGQIPGPNAVPARDVQVPLSALEHYEYCPRQAALILLEDGYADDAATVRGSLLHQHVHEPGEDTRAGVQTLRALPVWHESLGMTGVCDVVELHDDGCIVPVEHKSGQYVQGGPADVQLAGQAMCLEEMFRADIGTGAIFSAADRRRHVVTITGPLRRRVAAAIRDVRAILSQGRGAASRRRPAVPPMLNESCVPAACAGWRLHVRAGREAAV